MLRFGIPPTACWGCTDEKAKRETTLNLCALPPRAAAAWVERGAPGATSEPPRRIAPSPPARPAAEKRNEARRCRTRRDFPGAARASDEAGPPHFPGWARRWEPSLHGANQTLRQERLTPRLPGLSRRGPSGLLGTRHVLVVWRTTFPSSPRRESNSGLRRHARETSWEV